MGNMGLLMTKYYKSKNDAWIDSLKNTWIKNAIRANRRKLAQHGDRSFYTQVKYVYPYRAVKRTIKRVNIQEGISLTIF